jgi:hypothetical protein
MWSLLLLWLQTTGAGSKKKMGARKLGATSLSTSNGNNSSGSIDMTGLSMTGFDDVAKQTKEAQQQQSATATAVSNTSHISLLSLVCTIYY